MSLPSGNTRSLPKDWSDANRRSRFEGIAIVSAIFGLGLWLVVIRPLGPNLGSMPGSLVDARFINYMLEHFARWLRGLDKSYWNASFFYPYPWTAALGNTLLGSAPLYAMLRSAGLDRESAFQGWYILSFVIDYAASACVLCKLRFTPLATGMGAFFFSFGLPALAQETHTQFAYRFCVPLACYFLWRFYEGPRLREAAAFLLAIVWQFYLEIYTGLLLSLLVLAIVLILPLLDAASWQRRFLAWPMRLRTAWIQARSREKTVSLLVMSAALVLLVGLLIPYFIVFKTYGFLRSPQDIAPFLPRPQSYLIADNSMMWSFLGRLLPAVPQRQEQQLFPGIVVVGLVIAGLLGRFPQGDNRRLARVHLAAAACVVLLTLDIHGYSLYSLLWRLPGLDSIRAPGRFVLIAMWPLALYCARAVDGISSTPGRQRNLAKGMLYVLAAGLMLESILYHHTTLSKADAEVRLAQLRANIPGSLPASPVLFVLNPGRPGYVMPLEVDAMLLSQDLGWPTLNGYSGNFPPGYEFPDHCLGIADAFHRIGRFMHFAGITDPGFASGVLDRIVWIGQPGCVK